MQHILFDLDGTLTDPAEGITASVAYALEKMNQPALTRPQLEMFIGPPLNEGFSEFCGLCGPQIDEAIVLFREYFAEKGIHGNEIFAGMQQLLQNLTSRGKTLHVATTKPTFFAQEVLKSFDIARYFTSVHGSPLEHQGLPKAQVVKAVLDDNNIAITDAVMIGDRKHDVIGAKENGVCSIGVLYGYGSRQEMEAAQPSYIADTVQDLEALLLNIAP